MAPVLIPLFLAIVGNEVEFGAGGGFEFGGAFCAGEIVTDAEGVAFDFVDARESFAGVGSFGADDGHPFWFRRGVEGPGTGIGLFTGDGDFVVLVGKGEGDLFEDFAGHGLCAEFGFDGNPGALKGFDVGGVVGGERGQAGGGDESDAKEFRHDVSFV